MKGPVRLLGVAALAGAVVEIAAGQPVIFTASNGASSAALFSPGSWMSIFGANLAAYWRIVSFGALPVLAWLTYQFPKIGNIVSKLFQPGVPVIK